MLLYNNKYDINSNINSYQNLNDNYITNNNHINQVQQENINLNINIDNKKLLCIDIFRGITLFYMVIVNSNIDENIYWIFTETEWNGLKPADCIFPIFLFIMGVSITLSNPSENKCKSLMRLLKRSYILFF